MNDTTPQELPYMYLMYIVPYVCRSGKIKRQVGVLQTGDSGLAPTIVHSKFFALDLSHHRGGLKLCFKHTLLNLPAQAIAGVVQRVQRRTQYLSLPWSKERSKTMDLACCKSFALWTPRAVPPEAL